MTAATQPMSEAAALEAAATNKPLFFQRRFLPMWTAFSLGVFADNMLRQALLIGVTFGYITLNGIPDGLGVPIIGALFAMSMLTFSTIAGQFADKHETAFMFRRTKFVEMLVMISAAIGFLIGSGYLLVLSLFAMGAQSAFFSPARIGAMPKYFATHELIRANSFFSAALFVSILLGLLLGGMLIAKEGGPAIVSVFLVVASVCGWLAVRRAPDAAPTAPDLKIDWNLFRQGAQIFKFAFGSPGVVRPMLGFGLFYYMSTLITVLITVYAPNDLGADEGVANIIMLLFTFGAGAGAICASVLAKGGSGFGAATYGVGAAGVMTLVIIALSGAAAKAGAGNIGELFSSPAGIALAVSFVLCSACMGLFIVPLQAAIQRRAPAEQRSRIMAASNMLNAGSAVLGSLSVAFVTLTGLTATNAFLIIAAIQFSIALYMIRRRQTVTPGLYDEALTAAPLAKTD